MGSSSVDWKRLNSPFPPPPRSLPAFSPSLHFHEQDVGDTELPIGQRFVLNWETARGGRLWVRHVDDPAKLQWATHPGRGFVVAARGEALVEESRGSFAIHDTAALLLPHQVVTHVRRTADGGAQVHGVLCSDWAAAHALVSGQRSGVGGVGGVGGARGCPRWRCWAGRAWWQAPRQLVAPYWLTFQEAGAHRLTFHLRVAPPSLLPPGPSVFPPSTTLPHRSPDGRASLSPGPPVWAPFAWLRSYWQSSASVRPSDPLEPLLSDDPPTPQHPPLNRVGLVYSSNAAERFFGFGEQFSFFDCKGRRVSVLVQEQGLGRGDQPITAAANFASHRSGGSPDSTYAPVPFYMTSQMRCLFLDNYEPALFDLTAPDRVAVHVHASDMRGNILVGASPPQLIELYTAVIGRMRRLPDWVHAGAIVGMQGGTERVLGVLRSLAELGVPVAAVWLQDWCGQRKTSFGKQLWWNWELDTDHYAGWQERLRPYTEEHNIRIMTYVNPYLADVSAKPNARRSLLAEALSAGYLVTTRAGRPYFIENTSFHAAMVDLTNPAAAAWLKDVIKAMLHTCGAAGYMADFGEALPFDACLHSGESPDSAHNLYPELWARLNAEVFQEYAAERTAQGRCGEHAPLRLPAQPPQEPAGAGGEALLEERVLQAVADELAAAGGPPDVAGLEVVREGELPLADCLDQALPAARSADNLEALVLPDPAAGEAEAAGDRPPAGAGQASPQDSCATAAEMGRIEEDARGRSGEEERAKRPAAGDGDDDGVFFMRAGFRGSPRLARLFWLGDQMVSWQRHDGIKSAVTGLLTGGLAGYAYNHSDIGGYTTVVHPLIRYRRSEELLLRWMELNAFTTVFRTHEGNIPGANVQFYSSPRTLAHFRRCALLHQAWAAYRRQLVRKAADTGLPVARHLFLHYPTDPKVWRLTYEQFLVGTELLVVPVLDRAAASVAVYLPATDAGERWRHVWTGREWAAPPAGTTFRVEAELGYPAVFVKAESSVGKEFEANLRAMHLV